MAKPAKSQWNFGELFPPEQTRRVLTVSELTTQVRRLLEQHIGTIWVTGEITNLRVQASGHIYFTLKDASTQAACVLFRGESVAQRDLLQDGQKVILQGDITVYEARGQYQLIVRRVELQGLGAFQAAFERLKQKLAAEGLFAAERKRPLPRFPKRIGLVTSATGAAIRDVLHVVQRRDPALEILLVPARVQGQGAAEEIAAAIGLLNDYHASHAAPAGGLDMILITRGGGSLEDLWAFNEEVVARAIAASKLPVVSAVGHEIDFTIADFVADVRAATPSAAAEIITDGIYSSRAFVGQAVQQLRDLCEQQLAGRQEALAGLNRRLMRLHPRRQLNERAQRLDDLRSGIERGMKQGLQVARLRWQQLASRLHSMRPTAVLRQERERADALTQQLTERTAHRLGQWKSELAQAEARLRLLGPEQVLARGYSITMDADSGTILSDAKNVKPGQRLKTRLKTGEVTSVAEK
ncbi:MAG TPA: exodeoxyribonuclease VII large subunit [Verrucomicrobiae bacterium]|nr:exodeoxyribonuclease VII large subunit [Verrucomicrobiae bacterium]